MQQCYLCNSSGFGHETKSSGFDVTNVFHHHQNVGVGTSIAIPLETAVKGTYQHLGNISITFDATNDLGISIPQTVVH